MSAWEGKMYWFMSLNEILIMVKINYLEESDGNPMVEILVDIDIIHSIDLICRGGDILNYDVLIIQSKYCLGYHCCSRDRVCSEGEGSCNRDDECKNGDVCRIGSCTSFFGHSGGLWEPTDSCCQKRCTEQHLCDDGIVSLPNRVSLKLRIT